MYTLNEDVDMQAKMAALSRRLKELEARGALEIKVVNDFSMQIVQCSICQYGEHLVEQAIVNLSKVMADFFGDQKNINTQFAISKLTSMHMVDEVKSIITLRGGKQVDQPMPKPKENKGGEQEENVKEQEKGKEVNEDDRSKEDEIVSKEVKKKNKLLSPHFPKTLQLRNVVNNATEIFEVLKQVKVKIPLLDMIKQVPPYAKFLKDLCTMKRGLNINKKAFLTEQVSVDPQFCPPSTCLIRYLFDTLQ
ncbi:hypothetical protein CK203_051679 [Vitis vinifera]|uniref:Uncharacterized protein n=1 Tax=Vitis vinifera TaxID=29760 RepID=A0A438H5H2_VITVI|nr:hypothetical protein CK203_051679 [Vitis vinifera]